MRPPDASESRVVSSVPKTLKPVLLSLRELILSVHPTATIIA